MIISEVIKPQTSKVIPIASTAGQTVGSGSFCGREWFHPGGNAGGVGFGISESMRLFHEWVGGGRSSGQDFLARFAVPADEQAENSTEIDQAGGNPH